MSHGLFKAYVVTMASGGTMSSEVDLGRCYQNVYLGIPTMASSTDGLRVYASNQAGGTYWPVTQASLNSSTVTTNDYVIASAASQTFVPVPNGLRYLKVNTVATVAGGAVFKIICGD